MDPVKIAIVGAGDRGSVYARWAATDPARARVVAVAEPDPARRKRFAAEHRLPPDAVFSDWKEMAALDRRIADAVVVSTLDHQHAEPAIALARLGYHLMLEKPMAPDPRQCAEIVDAAQNAGVILAVCHVLRYAPYTTTVKHIVDSGRLGQIASVQHLEPIGFWHHAHSYVRGNWRREAVTSFTLLAKSSHDLDWLQYVLGRRITRVASFGGLTHFTAANRPADAADRCLDCPIEADCAYSASRFYHDLLGNGHRDWPLSVVIDEFTPQALDTALRDGPYGRCVYASDNDVVDHQIVAMEFDGGASGVFTMVAFSEGGHRQTRIFGSKAELRCDGETIQIHDFLTRSTEVVPVGDFGGHTTHDGHAGGDALLVAAFIDAVASEDASLIQSGGHDSLTTHLSVFAAEQARRSGSVVSVPAPADLR